MKVDMTKVKKGSSELTPECLHLINEISQCNSSVELLNFLEKVKVWVYGKCELYHWINTLDRFDGILEEAAKPVNGNEHILQCDVSFSEQVKFCYLTGKNHVNLNIYSLITYSILLSWFLFYNY